MATHTQFRYALAVARHGSFSGAARAAAISQPALSMQIARLEDELGVRLFDRSARPVAITPAAAALLPHFQAVIDRHRHIAEVAASLTGALTGSYRLGLIPTLAPTLLPLVLPQFARSCPDVRLEIREATTDAILDALRRDTLDGGILATPLDEAGIEEWRLFDEPLSLLAGPGVSLPDRDVSLSELPMDRLVVMDEGHCLRTQVLDLCALRDAGAPRFRIQAGSIATLAAVVTGGAWITVLPELALDALDPATRAGRVRQFSGPTPYREVGFVSRRTELRSAIRERLIAAVRRSVEDRGAVEGMLLLPR